MPTLREKLAAAKPDKWLAERLKKPKTVAQRLREQAAMLLALADEVDKK